MAGARSGAGSLGAATPHVRWGPSTSSRLARAAVFALVVGVVGVGGPALWTAREASGRVVTVSAMGAVSPRPVALVLGAGLTRDGSPQPFLAARLDVAAQLYQRGDTQVLLLSGARQGDSYDEPAAMRAYLLARGVPAEAMVLDTAGDDTYASCYRAAEVYGLDEVLVVSQTYHLPRALAICRHLGLDARGVGDDTMRQRQPGIWREGELREYGANVKAVWDVFVRTHPAQVQADRDPAVRAALAGGR